MAIITNITGSGWATSGTANAANSGIHFLNGTSLVYTGSSDVPPGSVATGYISGTTNTTLDFTIDAGNTAFQGGQTDYWCRFWIRGQRDTNALPADQTALTGPRLWSVTDGSIKLTGTFAVKKNGVSDGLTLYNETFNGAGGTKKHLSNGGAAGAQAYIPFNPVGQTGGWQEMIIHVTDGASGVLEFFLNGCRIAQITGIDFTNATNFPTGNPGVLASSTSWKIAFQAVSGVIWQLCAPIESWQGTDITIRPRTSAYASTDAIRGLYPTRWTALGASNKGSAWTGAGSGITFTETDYASAGINPYRSRLVVSGSDTNVATLTSIDNLGTLPYNSYGWATVGFPHTLCTNGTWSVSLRDSGNASDVVILSFDGTNLKQGSTVLAPITAADRFQLLIHLNSDGRAAFSLHDLTADINSAQNWWSGMLSNWTPQSLGPILQTMTLTATNGANKTEMDGAFVASWVDVIGVDSLTEQPVNGPLTPTMHTANGFAAAFAHLEEAYSIPGGCIPFGTYSVPNGTTQSTFQRTHMGVIVGRSGRTIANLLANVIPYMNYSFGIRLILADGASINDIASVTTEANRLTIVTTMMNSHQTIIQTLLANKNQVWYTTMLRREKVGQATYSNLQLEAINDLNTQLRTQVAQYQSENLISFSDVSTEVPNHSLLGWADDTHPTAAGYATATTYMVYKKQTPASRVGAYGRRVIYSTG